MVRFIALAAAAYLIYRLIRGPKKKPPPGPSDETVVDQMIQDPYCGAYFPSSKAVPAKVDGQKLYFCSEKCRDAYLARYRAHDAQPREEERS